METREIPLSRGQVAIVDVDDFERLNQFKWRALKGFSTFYSYRTTPRKDGQKSIYMHREILGLKPGDGQMIDHCRKGVNNE